MNAYTTIQRTARMLTAEEETDLFAAYRNGDPRAARELIEAHMPLIHKVSGRYSRFGPNHDDAVQEGIAGFIQGLDHFDPERGTRINTLCRWWIRASVGDWARNNHSPVKIGTTAAQKKLFATLKDAMARRGIYTDTPSEQQILLIAQDLGVDADDVREMSQRMASNAVVSIDAPTHGEDGEGSSRVDLIADERDLDIDERIDDQRRRDALYTALDTLDGRKRDIIVRRYLVDETETLEDLSLTYGVTRERIRQLEVQAIEQLGLQLPVMLSEMAGQERRTARR